MGWVHCHRRYGACLALAALALQVVLSFGHVHLDRAAAASATIATAHGKALSEISRQAPAQNPADDDDYCAICASIFLASTSFIALPPLLPVPGGFARIVHSYSGSFGAIPPRRLAFQSRAPPAA